MTGALQAVGIVVAFAVAWTCIGGWRAGRRRNRAIARIEAQREVGIPERRRITRPGEHARLPASRGEHRRRP